MEKNSKKNRFEVERKYFKILKKQSPPAAVAEYEDAVRKLLEEYNTTVYENRFIVGGAVEHFTVMLLRSAGIKVTPCGDLTKGGDIMLPEDRLLSIKGCFTSSGSIRLINTMGNTVANWDTATLFIISGMGIIYGDPEMVSEGDLLQNKDALVLKRKAVNRFASDPNNLLQVTIANKKDGKLAHLTRKASNDIARRILKDRKLDILFNQDDEES